MAKLIRVQSSFQIIKIKIKSNSFISKFILVTAKVYTTKVISTFVISNTYRFSVVLDVRRVDRMKSCPVARVKGRARKIIDKTIKKIIC